MASQLEHSVAFNIAYILSKTVDSRSNKKYENTNI